MTAEPEDAQFRHWRRQLMRSLNQQGREFSFSDFVASSSLDPAAARGVAEAVYARFLVQILKDLKITDRERRQLEWLGDRLEIEESRRTALQSEANSTTYREQLVEAWADGQISDEERHELEELRNLLAPAGDAIENPPPHRASLAAVEPTPPPQRPVALHRRMYGMVEGLFEAWIGIPSGRLGTASPSVDDPVARRTDWHPVRRGGSRLLTHKLVDRSPRRVEIIPAMTVSLYFVGVAILGVGVCLVPLLGMDLGQIRDNDWAVQMFLVGLVMLVGSVVAYYLLRRPRVFDLDLHWFWIGRTPRDAQEVRSRRDAALLDHVHAIQLVEERIWRRRSGDYISYEINLVLTDGSRVNVVDHGKLAAIRFKADRISQLLGVPIWTAPSCSR